MSSGEAATESEADMAERETASAQIGVAKRGSVIFVLIGVLGGRWASSGSRWISCRRRADRMLTSGRASAREHEGDVGNVGASGHLDEARVGHRARDRFHGMRVRRGGD